MDKHFKYFVNGNLNGEREREIYIIHNYLLFFYLYVS